MWVGKRSTTQLSILTLFSTISLVQFETCQSHETKIYSLKLRTSHETISDLGEDVRDRRRRSVDLHVPGNPGVRWTPVKNNLRGKAGQGYYIELGLGTPTQNLHVLVDTGSANFAVAAAPHQFINTYFRTNESSTYKDLNRKVKVPYTQGEWDGKLCQDMTRIMSGPDVPVMANIAGITHSEEFFINGSNWQGILGLGYAEIARPDNTVEPFFTTLVREGHVDDIFAMQLCGSHPDNKTQSTEAEVAGTLTVGGVDESLYNGTMWYTPTRKEWFYEVVIVDMEVNNESLAMDCKEYNFDKTIVDSGTTNLRLPQAVFAKLNERIGELLPIPKHNIPADFWIGEQLLCRDGPVEPWDWFPIVSIVLQGRHEEEAFKLVLSPKQYLRSVKSEGEHCYKYGISPSETGAVIGAVVMEGFYVVFDRNNKSVGFALSTCAGIPLEFHTPPMKDLTIIFHTGGVELSYSITNPYTPYGRLDLNLPHMRCSFQMEQKDFPLTAPNVVGPLYYNSTGCAYNSPTPSNGVLMIVAYIMAGLCVLCLMVPLVFLYVHWQMEKCREKTEVPEDNGLLEPNESDS